MKVIYGAMFSGDTVFLSIYARNGTPEYAHAFVELTNGRTRITKPEKANPPILKEDVIRSGTYEVCGTFRSEQGMPAIQHDWADVAGEIRHHRKYVDYLKKREETRKKK
jgi:hypothetical protein